MSLRPDARPLYLLVIDKLKQDIEEGKFKPGYKLPSENELAKTLGVSRATLREALRILEDENIIIRKHGIGTFVIEKPVFTSGIEELYSITQMIEKNGYKAGTIYLNIREMNPSKEDLEGFQLQSAVEIVRIERIRTANDEPVVYCIDKIPESVLPSNFNFQKDGSIFKVLDQNNIHISYAITDIKTIGYHEKISPLLHLTEESSLLVLKQVHYDTHDNPVLISINYFRPDKFRFHVLRKR